MYFLWSLQAPFLKVECFQDILYEKLVRIYFVREENHVCIQKTREQKGTKNFPLTTLTHKSWVLAHAKTT